MAPYTHSCLQTFNFIKNTSPHVVLDTSASEAGLAQLSVHLALRAFSGQVFEAVALVRDTALGRTLVIVTQRPRRLLLVFRYQW